MFRYFELVVKDASPDALFFWGYPMHFERGAFDCSAPYKSMWRVSLFPKLLCFTTHSPFTNIVVMPLRIQKVYYNLITYFSFFKYSMLILSFFEILSLFEMLVVVVIALKRIFFSFWWEFENKVTMQLFYFLVSFLSLFVLMVLEIVFFFPLVFEVLAFFIFFAPLYNLHL